MFAITQCGVENYHLIVHVRFLFSIVNRFLPVDVVFRYKKTRICVRVCCHSVWLFFFHSLPARSGHDKEEVEERKVCCHLVKHSTKLS
ncbi:hypothetical protein DU976_10750 [Vibrio navarrensis]|nr:hypothetical protein [Vibrio navarrensis]EHA1125611.1 hypothetical protein [Vibrio navarrensis]MBH9742002.1 hypothetical protein [Vibrio navarrensis]